MADWIDHYEDFFPDEAEIDRMFRMYEKGLVSKAYLMTFFALDDEGFEQVAGHQRIWEAENDG